MTVAPFALRFFGSFPEVGGTTALVVLVTCAMLGNFFAAQFSLDLIRWPTGPEIRTVADVEPGTSTQLAIVAGPVIALSFIPWYLCTRGYNIDRGRHAEIQTALVRRSQGGQA